MPKIRITQKQKTIILFIFIGITTTVMLLQASFRPIPSDLQMSLAVIFMAILRVILLVPTSNKTP